MICKEGSVESYRVNRKTKKGEKEVYVVFTLRMTEDGIQKESQSIDEWERNLFYFFILFMYLCIYFWVLVF